MTDDRTIENADVNADEAAQVEALTMQMREALAEHSIPVPCKDVNQVTGLAMPNPQEMFNRAIAVFDVMNPHPPSSTQGGSDTSSIRAAGAETKVMTMSEPVSEAATQLDENPTPPSLRQKQIEGQDALARKEMGIREGKTVEWASRYLIKQKLGSGGQGVVYLGECQDDLCGVQSEKTYQALKVNSPMLYKDFDDPAAAYREDMHRLSNVRAVMHRIHHDNLVDVQRIVDYDGIFVFVMHWIEGFDLRQLQEPSRLAKLKPRVDADTWDYLNNVIYGTPSDDRLSLTPLMAVDAIEKPLRGLHALHKKGIVHGDIKPSNIMLDYHGSIRLVDIGSAHSFESPPERKVRTLRYAPPEFLERGEWTPLSDIASTGYVLLELLTGRSDFLGPVGRHCSVTVAEPELKEVLLEAKTTLIDRLPELLPKETIGSDELLRLVRKLIHPDPEQRFEDADHAVETDPDGTYHFRMRLVKGDLACHEATHIGRWINYLWEVDPAFVEDPTGTARA